MQIKEALLSIYGDDQTGENIRKVIVELTSESEEVKAKIGVVGLALLSLLPPDLLQEALKELMNVNNI